ncbi:AI-2E family transporter [Scleromatobacter humisilvae]|uniref:AI-2E family transporter n=1 Tax=Scleromatobacter humisilvae TaxID=2897159 RepID=A0A9X1YJN6_9BURK|nr:AI-2E family transporter [Scleromatobacter humisilvae]MCK9686110.1 AI-2E family transporter [Scleromatobacter humisilvae]
MSPSTREQTIRLSSYLLAAVALVGVLELHLLVPLLVGLLVYQLVVSITPLAQRWFNTKLAKMLVVILFASVVIAAIAGAVFGLVSFFRSDIENLPHLLAKVSDILDRVRAGIPPFMAAYLPDDIADLQQKALDWLRAHVAELQMMGAHTLVTVAETIIAIVIGVVLSLREVDPHATPGPLARALTARAEHFAHAFRNVALSQLSISLLNTSFTAIYLVIGLHLFGVHLPLTKTMIAITFIVGLLPIVGNLTSNTIVVIVSLAHSPAVAVASLVFLIVIHKLEYFLGARIVGTRIKSQIWELLIAMMVMEALFGIPGLVAAPIYYAYLKSELLDAKLI